MKIRWIHGLPWWRSALSTHRTDGDRRRI